MGRMLFAFRGKYESRKNQKKKLEGELLTKMLDYFALIEICDKVFAFSFLQQSQMPDGLDFICRLFSSRLNKKAAVSKKLFFNFLLKLMYQMR